MTKRLLLTLVIIAELILIFLFPIIFLRKPEKAFGIHIDGRYFNTTADKTVQLKGISTKFFVRDNPNLNRLIEIFGIFKKRNINLITLYLSPDKINKKLGQLDSIVAWSKKNSIYIYMVPTIDVKSNSEKSILKRRTDFMNLSLYLINRYKNDDNVMFGLWAEPRLITRDEWQSYYQMFINKARLIKNNVVIGIAGLYFGRSFGDEINFNYKNIFLDFHDYPATDVEQLRQLKMKNFLWDKYIDKYPILIGEFGGVYSSGFGTKEDIGYFQTVIDQANKHMLSYVAFTIDPIESDGGLSLIDWATGKLTKKGQIFVDTLPTE